jgi:membrane protein
MWPARFIKRGFQYILLHWITPFFDWIKNVILLVFDWAKRVTAPGFERAKKIYIPGFDGIPLYDVGTFFFKGLRDGAINTRSAAVSFNLFVALFPAIIFIFTLIPVLPVKNFQAELLMMIQSMLPESVYVYIQKTIEEIITKPHSSLLSIGFVLTLIFSTNGILSLIQSFNASVNIADTRSWIELRLISILLLLILFLLMATGISLIVFTQKVLHILVREGIMRQNFVYYVITLGKWIVILALFFFAFSFLFYLGPARKSKWRFISAGSTFATILCIVITLGFSFYIDHFGKYNALYGSIGAIPVIMVMINLNCQSLIIGFELNSSIMAARRKNDYEKNGATLTPDLSV